MDDRALIGDNKPPSVLDFGRDTIADMAVWLDNNPVVDREEIARDGKLQVDRVKSCIQDIETERRGMTDPLNQRVKEINGKYSLVREPLQQVMDQIKSRLDDFIRAEQQKRLKAAEEARKALEEAERKAREAEQAEQEAIEEANQGVADTGVMDKTLEANKSFAEYEAAQRAAARAEKDVDVKIGGGFRRALSQRTKEVLTLSDWKAAIEEMGVTDKIREAVLSSAREYRKVFGDLPEGIIRTEEQVI